MRTASLSVHEHKPESGAAAKSLVILLHGLGADGGDLIGLAPHWAGDLPDTVFVSPDAPFRCDMSPFGYQWFSLQEWTPESILRGVEHAAPILDSFISQQQEKYGIAEEKTALVGFSQGTMMSLYVAPRRAKAMAGVLGYSGALVGADGLHENEEIYRIPIHLIHGTADEVIPAQAFHAAMKVLEEEGFPVTGTLSPGLAHGIDAQGVMEGGRFLKKILAG